MVSLFFLFIPAAKHFIRIHHSRHDMEPLPRFKMGHIVKKNTYICKNMRASKRQMLFTLTD